MSLDKLEKKETPEDLAKKEKEISDGLAGFGNDEKKDGEFLEKTKGSDIVKSVSDDLDKKSKELNDPKAKARIEELSKNIKGYSDLGKLSKEQAQEISDIYKKINSIEGTEHAEDAKGGEEAQKSSENKKQSDAQKLVDACEKLEALLKGHHEEAQEKVKSDAKKGQEVRDLAEKTRQQEVNSFEANLEFPPSQKETTNEA